MEQTARVRLDKWLWAARFFKTRTLAGRACELGRIQIGGQSCKPSREIRPGDRLTVTTEAGEFGIEVLAASEIRGPAALARTYYTESDASVERRAQLAEQRRALKDVHGYQPAPARRPSKRDRRQIHQFREERE